MIVRNMNYEAVYILLNILKEWRGVAAHISLIEIAVLEQSPEAWILEEIRIL